ncbi:MAG: T9SS type A sorting domain-containing protein [Bacteroidetes bacterium]|nr:T9SS type A sorting domain-containing protein [Bacteroidota bacterium]
MKTIFRTLISMQWIRVLSVILFVLVLSNNAKSQYASPNPVCYGEPINLFCNLPGCGVPDATYTWTNRSGSWIYRAIGSAYVEPVLTLASPTGYASDFFYLQVQYSPPPQSGSGGRVWVTVWPEIIVTGVALPVSCSPGCIYPQVTGGHSPYSYQWSTNSTTKDICNLPCGIYTVTVTDAQNCKAVNSWEIKSDLAISATVHKASCNPGNDASIDLSVSGGCPPYTYAWNNTNLNQDIYNIDCGTTYCVTVTDSYCGVQTGCWTYEDVILNALITDANAGCSDGAINLTASCGTPPFVYQWTKVGSGFTAYTEDIGGLGPGWYCVTVIDFNSISRTCCWEVNSKKSTCQSNYLQDITLPGDTNVCYAAVQNIIVAGNGTSFKVQNGDSVILVAGEMIRFLPGTSVYEGGDMHGYITTDGNYCTNKNGNRNANAEETVSGSIPEFIVSGNQLFKVYPNPTAGNLILELGEDVNAAQVKVDIYSIRGEKILSAELNGERKREFSLSDKPSGLYFIRVITGKQTGTGKIIKQ